MRYPELSLHCFNNTRERTAGIVACIPPDKIEWSGAAGKFTPGDLARHIAATERTERNVVAVGATAGRGVIANWWKAATRLCDLWNVCTTDRRIC
jgi:hypothetical protein